MSHENLSDIEKMDNNNLNRIVSLLPTGEKKYNLSNKVKIIGREAFKYNMSFEQIFLHDNIEFIEPYAFYYCSIKKCILPPKIININNNTFDNCCYLLEMHIPGNIKTICKQAFKLCSRLEKLTFEPGLINIGVCAFEDCFNLTEIKYFRVESTN